MREFGHFSLASTLRSTAWKWRESGTTPARYAGRSNPQRLERRDTTTGKSLPRACVSSSGVDRPLPPRRGAKCAGRGTRSCRGHRRGKRRWTRPTTSKRCTTTRKNVPRGCAPLWRGLRPLPPYRESKCPMRGPLPGAPTRPWSPIKRASSQNLPPSPRENSPALFPLVARAPPHHPSAPQKPNSNAYLARARRGLGL